MDETILEQEPQAPVRVVDIQFRTGSKVYFFDPGALELNQGDHVIVDTARGPEYGTCASDIHEVSPKEIVPPLRPILRKATKADERTLLENQEKEKRAFDICQQKISEHGLDMQLVSAEYAFDGSKIVFFFTADDRVDFRELVRNLASIFRTRIELRQIGVRDKAKMVGGLGICGRPFCCKEFLEDFQPVSIKMAKTQNLSLNPTKISGTCGRLMCCLKYEQEAYEDLIRTSPKAESFVDTPDGRGTVTEVNLLRQSVKVRMEEQPEEIGCYQNCEICVLRNGKAKKTDPPIPADLAPISGNGKRPRLKETPPEPKMSLDPIRFRYRPDDIVPETPEEAPETEDRRPPRRKKRPGGHPAQKEGSRPPRQKGQDPDPEQSQSQGKPKGQKPRGPRPQKPQNGAKPKEAQATKAQNSQGGKPQEGQAPNFPKAPAEGAEKQGSGRNKPYRRNNYRSRNRGPKPGGNSNSTPQQ